MEDGLLPETFERQMNFFAENGYSVVTLGQVLDHMNRHVRLSPKSIAVTIDGGYQDAFPIAFLFLRNMASRLHSLFHLNLSGRKGQLMENR